jgi:predicted metalloprotease
MNIKAILIILIFPFFSKGQNFGLFVSELETYWTNKFRNVDMIYNKPVIYVVNNEYNLFYQNGTIRISKPLINDLQKIGASDSFFNFIIAHEYAHSALYQLKELPIISAMREYQADCLAGAYFKHQNKFLDINEIYKLFNLLSEESNKLTFRNLIIEGHGTNLQRINAIEKGYKTGNIMQCINDYKLY